MRKVSTIPEQNTKYLFFSFKIKNLSNLSLQIYRISWCQDNGEGYAIFGIFFFILIRCHFSIGIVDSGCQIFNAIEYETGTHRGCFVFSFRVNINVMIQAVTTIYLITEVTQELMIENGFAFIINAQT